MERKRIFKLSRAQWVSVAVLASSIGLAAAVSIPNTFTAGTTISASQVNANFAALGTAVTANEGQIATKQNRVTGTCPAGQAVQSVNADGSVVCQTVGFFGGDGSAGDLTVAAAVNWNTTPPANPNFANVTINAGQTLTVPAGTTIRCTGTFTNNGTLSVLTGASGQGTNWGAAAPSSSGPAWGAHPGDSFGAATGGLFDDDSVLDVISLNGGRGGARIPEATARTSFNQFRIGGGSGAAANSPANGGGLVKIYCSGNISNTGTINADGANAPSAAGGGGGGIVVLASRTAVSNTGTISAVGGNGGSESTLFGAGGGGGGGIVVLVSPSAPVPGTISVTGGTGTTGASTQTVKGRLAGGGGGASGGNGGAGGSVSNTGLNASGANGSPGYATAITADPAFLLP